MKLLDHWQLLWKSRLELGLLKKIEAILFLAFRKNKSNNPQTHWPVFPTSILFEKTNKEKFYSILFCNLKQPQPPPPPQGISNGQQPRFIQETKDWGKCFVFK